MYQTLKTVFDHISKHVIAHHKYSALRHIFNSLLGVRKCGRTKSFAFEIFHKGLAEAVSLTWLLAVCEKYYLLLHKNI